MDEAAFEKDNYIETGMPADTGELAPDYVVEVGEEPQAQEFRCENQCALRVSSLNPEVLRFRFSSSGRFAEAFSYALDGKGEETAPALHADGEAWLLDTGALKLWVRRDGMRLRIEDYEGRVLSEDEKGFHWYENQHFGGDVVIMSRILQAREHFYGLGDIPGHKNLRGQRRMLWGSDVYGYGAQTDPLYKNIPFFIGLHHGKAYGIFFDNSFRSTFDFGRERADVSSFWAQGGEMDFYFIQGPTVPDVVARYAELTGKPEMPPLWALGFHQCKWSYKSEKEVLDIANGFQTREIPCDAIYVDIDYMDGFRCFTWNQQVDAYPNPRRLTETLEKSGIKTVAIIDPGIKIDPGYTVYESGIENDVFCRRMDGPLFKGNVWPGPCHFPEFTTARVRDWWADLFPPFISESGVAGIWTDMNEPAVFNDEKTFPRDVRHHYDGHPCSHRKAHNVYGMQMARATQEGLRRALPEKRPFVITRSAFAGTQRYSSAWTGDIQSTWEHLRIGSVQCQRLSLSGYSFVGTDIGGFSGRSDGELFVRWLQMGIFHPFCRVHSSGDENEQEPWSFGDPYTEIAKKFIELRYRLLPYLYTLFEAHCRTGAPLLRSLIYMDEQDPECHNRMEEFALGPDLLTCPVSKPNAEGRWMYLPRGKWFDFWTDELVEGGEEKWCAATLESTPIFVRAGCVFPLGPVRMSSSLPCSHMELHVYLDAHEARGELYEDEGDGYSFETIEGRVKKSFMIKRDGNSLILKQERDGGYHPPYQNYHVTLHGEKRKLVSVTIDNGSGASVDSPNSLVLPENFLSAKLLLDDASG